MLLSKYIRKLYSKLRNSLRCYNLGDSMQEIYVECEYTLLKKNAFSESQKNYCFSKIVDGITIKVDLSYKQSNIIVKVFGACLLAEHIEEIKTLGYFDGEKLSKPCREAINSITHQASQFTKDVLQLIKYHLSHDDIQENLFSIKSQKWGLTNNGLQDIPISLNVVFSGGSVCPLRNDSFKQLKESLNSNVIPLLAMRHLHRAKHESSPHHQWIDATIAAELAIKEVLSRAKPELEMLLLNVPSPPLSKLYGKILEKYLGEQSPHRKAIIKGSEVRNQLIHRHDNPSIDGQLAVNYVKDVEKAIFHLLTLLYPNDSLIKNTYVLKML